ncbi:hypothetical protein AMK11_14780 [Streptomyces sp. CB02414]|nr:hypothetical protein AMK11_14780 [Streptomyces sp. CB02414]
MPEATDRRRRSRLHLTDYISPTEVHAQLLTPGLPADHAVRSWTRSERAALTTDLSACVCAAV